jgi:UDP-N-acetylmuramoylalanine--D-glutamate ligase
MEKFLKIKNKNITFFDDSKATNYHAVNEATKLFSANQEEGILILHGTTKETLNNKLDIDPFFKHVIIPRDMNVNLGLHNAEIIYIEHIYDLKDILEKILIINQIVLFSCGGSSFNDFENYQVRGNYFKNTVRSMEIKDA